MIDTRSHSCFAFVLAFFATEFRAKEKLLASFIKNIKVNNVYAALRESKSL